MRRQGAAGINHELMKYQKQLFSLSLVTILISIVIATSQAGMPLSATNTQPNLFYSTAEAAQKTSKPFLLAEGKASYYANQFHGRKTANGETFNMHELTAAHPSLPFGTWVRVTNLRNGKDVIVRINDRGPFIKGRIIDLSKDAAKEIGLMNSGTVKVKLETFRSAPAGSVAS